MAAKVAVEGNKGMEAAAFSAAEAYNIDIDIDR